MKRKAILVEGIGFPKRVVQEIQTRPRTVTICPLCKTRFKKDDPTVLIDLVTRIQLTPGKNHPEQTVRIQICESCAQPVIQRQNKAMDALVNLFAEILVDDLLKKSDKNKEEKKQKTTHQHQ